MYNGTLFTIGGEKFPTKWIFKDSYQITPHALDLDSTRDANGKLQRNLLSHKSVTVTFQTVPMTLADYEEMWAFIRSKYIDADEKKLNCGYYNFETGSIETMKCYIPDITHNPNILRRDDGLFNSTTLEFIGY